MRRIQIGVHVLAAAWLLGYGVPLARADDTAVQPTESRAREDHMAHLLASVRMAEGLLPLARARSLDHAADAHARDMAARGYMEHESPEGSTPASRAAEAGYQTPPGSAWLVVETISARGDEPERALDWWLSDGLHRRVVLRPTWREVGVGFAAGGPYGRFWVLLFGCRPNVLPPVLFDGVLNIPDETCATSSDSFGRVHAVRAADTTTRLEELAWEPYTAQRAWTDGRPAFVQLRDTAGRVLDTQASDPAATRMETP